MAELAEIDILSLMEEERKAESLIAEARQRAKEIIKKAEDEANKIISDAEKSDIDIKYVKIEKAKYAKKIELIEKSLQEEIDRVTRLAELNFENTVKYIVKVVLYGKL